VQHNALLYIAINALAISSQPPQESKRNEVESPKWGSPSARGTVCIAIRPSMKCGNVVKPSIIIASNASPEARNLTRTRSGDAPTVLS